MVFAASALELFLGAWSLLSITTTYNGQVIPDSIYGEHPSGTIMYSPSGYMNAILTATEPDFRPADLTLPVKPNTTDEEWAKVGKHSWAYSGPFYVNDSSPDTVTTGQVVHGPLSASTLPSSVGTVQQRKFEFFDESQKLKLTAEAGGAVVELIWQRLPDFHNVQKDS